MRESIVGAKNPFYGKHHTEETKRKLSEKHKGKTLSTAHRKKISVSVKKTLSDSSITDKLSKASFKMWNNKEIRDKLISSRIGKKRGPHSDKTKLKISQTKKRKLKNGEIIHARGMLGKKHNKETREAISRFMKERRKTQVMPLKDTSIELKIQHLLSLLHLEFTTHKYISEITRAYQCDIFIPVQNGIPQKTVIECDGDYWHGNLDIYPVEKLCKRIFRQKRIDCERTAQLEEAGFRVIRLWEHEIIKIDLTEFASILKRRIKQ